MDKRFSYPLSHNSIFWYGWNHRVKSLISPCEITQMEAQNDKNHNLQYDNVDLQVYGIDYQRNNDCKAQEREAVRKKE